MLSLSVKHIGVLLISIFKFIGYHLLACARCQAGYMHLQDGAIADKTVHAVAMSQMYCGYYMTLITHT